MFNIAKKNIIALLIVMLSMSINSVEAQEASADTLRVIDELLVFPETDFRALYTMVTNNPGVSTTSKTYIVLRRDRANQYTVQIQQPESERGKAYLLLDQVLYAYDPGPPARFESTSSASRFEESSLRLSDFTQSKLAEEYTITNSSSSVLGRYQTTIYDLQALSISTTFQKRKIWVDEDSLIRKIEDYSASGQLLRTTAIVQYQRLSERYVPIYIVIENELEGAVIDGVFQHQKTIITVEQPTLGRLPDLYFTQAFLERSR